MMDYVDDSTGKRRVRIYIWTVYASGTPVVSLKPLHGAAVSSTGPAHNAPLQLPVCATHPFMVVLETAASWRWHSSCRKLSGKTGTC